MYVRSEKVGSLESVRGFGVGGCLEIHTAHGVTPVGNHGKL